MIDVLAANAGSFAATLGIALVCSYLGLFTVLRRIVFTGVALAQLAALGVSSAFFLGGLAGPEARELVVHHGGTAGSLGASILGALTLGGRDGKGRIAADARVGLAYAAAGALAVLLVWRSPADLAELQNILAGEVLLARSGELASLWAGLAFVVAVHARYRREFWLVSYDPEFAQALGLPERRLQVLFLLSLAVAVALALKAAGLLLVFAFLVFPPATGLLLGCTLHQAALVGAAAALGASGAGWLLAIGNDLPVAPTVAAVLFVFTAAAWVLGRVRPLAGALRFGLYVLALGALALLPLAWASRRQAREPAPTPPPTAAQDGSEAPGVEDGHDAHGAGSEHDASALREALDRLHHADSEERAAAARRLADLQGSEALGPLLESYVGEEDPKVCARCEEIIEGLLAHPEAAVVLDRVLHAPDADVRVHAALALVALGRRAGLQALVEALRDPAVPPFVKAEAIEGLREVAGTDFGLDPLGDEDPEALQRLDRWWTEIGSRLRWDPAARAWRSSR
ncbi:MAG: hypothetical protein D6731_03355 [Planctomycetota bacterium]|nr:MAG: hypothetical protein D6731_03355 [Planctomycetota bacterium]